MPEADFTKSYVENTQCPAGKKKHLLFDSSCKGLLVEIRPSGHRSYHLRYTFKGRQKQIKLCDVGSISVCEARKMAQKLYSRILNEDYDPLEAKVIVRQMPTIAAFINDTYIPFIKTYKRSWDTDVSLIKNHIIPNFGRLYLDEFTIQHMNRFINKHLKTHKPGSVNRVIILMRYIFNCALKWRTPGITSNPTIGVDLLEENNKKERFLTAAEANALIGALKSSDNQMLQYIIPMLILTGARKREVLDAKWEDFNFEQRIWRIPLSKLGTARHVPMSDGVISLLNSVPKHEECPYVFANPKTLLPFVSFFTSWDRVRKSVGLGDVRVHDLRHSFASFLINNGRTLYEVQRILGHTQIKTTQRYAHLNQETLLDAANQVSKAVPLLNMMPSKASEVTLIQIT